MRTVPGLAGPSWPVSAKMNVDSLMHWGGRCTNTHVHAHTLLQKVCGIGKDLLQMSVETPFWLGCFERVEDISLCLWRKNRTIDEWTGDKQDL